jgi:hypothetical protein
VSSRARPPCRAHQSSRLVLVADTTAMQQRSSRMRCAPHTQPHAHTVIRASSSPAAASCSCDGASCHVQRRRGVWCARVHFAPPMMPCTAAPAALSVSRHQQRRRPRQSRMSRSSHHCVESLGSTTRMQTAVTSESTHTVANSQYGISLSQSRPSPVLQAIRRYTDARVLHLRITNHPAELARGWI